MKKIILPLAVLLGTFSAQASTLLIENYCSQARARILYMVITKPGGQCEFQFPGTNLDYFMIDPMDSFTITDGDILNFQFPFLNVYPFSGNVSCLSPGSLIPVSLNSPDRYRFMIMRFLLDDAQIWSFSADMITETGSLTGAFDFLPGNPPYYVDYFRLGSTHYFSFSD